MKTYLFSCLFFLSFLSSATLVAQDNLYDEHEKETLRRFLRQPSNIEGRLNIDLLWVEGKLPVDTTCWETDEMWLILNKLSGLGWDTSSELHRLSAINYPLPDGIYRGKLSGNLDLSGFEYLTSVNVSKHNLMSINLSDCRKLEEFNCRSNPVQSLNLDNCSNLRGINCNYSRLKSLNLKGCSSLSSIEIMETPELVELKAKDCTNLMYLRCSNGQLQLLEVQGFKRLSELDCSGNRLTSLDLTGCLGLTNLIATGNQLTDLKIKDCALLENITVSGNRLTSIDLEGKKLKTLFCGGNLLTSLDIQIASGSVDCGWNQLTSLHIHGQNDGYRTLSIKCSNNQLTDLMIEGTFYSLSLDCSHNQLTFLDFDNFFLTAEHDWNQIYCHDNLLASFPKEKFRKYDFTCFNNQLPFAAIPVLENTLYLYAPQKPLSLSTSEQGTVDLIRYLHNDKTRFRWYAKKHPDTLLEDISGEGGIFVIPEYYANDTLVCKMTNNDFPYLRDNYSFQWNGYSFTGDARLTCVVAVTHTTGTDDVIKPAKPYTLYAADGSLYIETEKPSELMIYTLAGQLYTKRNVPAGKTVISLPKGFYIASLDGRSEKVKL